MACFVAPSCPEPNVSGCGSAGPTGGWFGGSTPSSSSSFEGSSGGSNDRSPGFGSAANGVTGGCCVRNAATSAATATAPASANEPADEGTRRAYLKRVSVAMTTPPKERILRSHRNERGCRTEKAERIDRV